jgi:hypothetical protein
MTEYQKFYKALQDIFISAKLKAKVGLLILDANKN